MKQKILGLLAAGALALSLAGPASAMTAPPTSDAAPAVAAATTGVCEGGDGSPTWHLWRNWSGYHFTGSRAVVKMRNVHGCTGGDGASMVFPANLQGNGVNVQFGYGRVCSTCNTIWLRTVNDHTEQLAWLSEFSALDPADLWGDDVRFSITEILYGGYPYWRLRLEVLSGSYSGATFDYLVDKTSNYATEAWSGIEVHDWQSQFGGQDSTHQVTIFDMAYRYDGDNGWTYMTGSSACVPAWANASTPVPSWIHESYLTSYDGYAPYNTCAVKGYTAAH